MASPLKVNQTHIIIPRVTTTERNALTPENGMLVYDTTLNQFYKYENGSWSSFGGSAYSRTIINGNTTAANDTDYTLVSNSTITDPSPAEGKGYTVLVRNGTATIGGTGYSTVGQLLFRVYHSGAWATYQLTTQTQLDGKENTISVGTTAQYFRGDKTFQTLDKAAVGLSNVDNTSDANKPISTATQTALNAKQDALGFTPENVTNKSDSYTASSSTTYSSTKALVDGLATKLTEITFQAGFSGFNPLDATTYYFGLMCANALPTTTATNWSFKFPAAQTITAVRIDISSNSLSGSNEDSTFYLRNITQGTSTIVGTFKTNNTGVGMTSTMINGLSIAVNTSDSYCLEWRTPTWATNPQTPRIGGGLYLT